MLSNSIKIIFLSLMLGSLVLCGCGGGESADTLEVTNLITGNGGNAPVGPAPILSFRVVNTFPHQTDAFTQGLVFENGRLLESTGLTGQSSLREVELLTGNVLRRVNLAANFFGEGLASRNGQLVQLTLNSGQAFVWDTANFTQVATRATSIPAWGITLTNQDQFAFSDGTSTVRFLNPADLSEVRRITVTDNGQEVNLLNELEFINGLLYANRFTTDEIVAINPNTGVIQFRINLAGIIDKQAFNLGANDVLNGIAFDAAQGRLFVTGKRWPFLYQIEIVQ